MDKSMLPPDWTPLQEAYTQKLMATYQANLYFFKEKFPEVFRRVMERDLKAPFEVGPGGEVTIFSGKYKGDERDYVDLGKMLYRIFEDPKSRPRIRVDTEFIEDPRAAAPHLDNPHFYRKVEPQYRMELIQRFIDMTPEPGDRLDTPDFGDHKVPIAVVFGSGYGWHLDRLVDDWEIRHLLIADTDVERLNLSLYFVDYVSLHARFARKGFYFTVALEEDPDALANDLRVMLYHLWPPYFMQGAAIFFHDYDSTRVHELWNNLKRDLWTMYRGWGYLDDEVVGLKHALENAVDRIPLYTRKPDLPEDATAFVIGSGPSLDGLLPFLREQADRAVIISCGSAITALANAGIKPDVHIEVERTFDTYAVLRDTSARELLRDMPVVALNIMHPGVFSLTSKPLMILKDLDAGCSLADFYREYARFRSNPTCTNGGADLALRMGFKHVYLLGVDYGFRDETQHHAKASMYFDEKQDEFTDALTRIVELTHAAARGAREIEANFGGKVLSTDTFIHSRDALQISIKEFASAKVYNLNDGAAIEGAIPQRVEEAVVVAEPGVKQRSLEAMLGAFTTDYDADPFARLDFLLVQLKAVREDIERIVKSNELKCRMDAFDMLFDIHHYLFAPDHQAAQIFPLLRGSMLHMGRFFFDCVGMFKSEEKAVEFARFGFDLILRYIDAAHETVASLHEVGRKRLAARQAGEPIHD